MPVERVGVEHEVALVLPDGLDSHGMGGLAATLSAHGGRSLPPLTLTTWSTYFDTPDQRLRRAAASLAVKHVKAAESSWVMLKETLGFSWPVRHSLEIAVKVPAQRASDIVAGGIDMLPLARAASVFGVSDAALVPQLVLAQFRQKRRLVCADGHHFEVSVDEVRVDEAQQPRHAHSRMPEIPARHATFIEIEGAWDDAACRRMLCDATQIYTAAGAVPTASTKYERFSTGKP
jgi:hypothetical protein